MAVATLLLVVLFSILLTRIATVALTHTGLSRQTAKFQARSAFTGVGFTTNESEKVVNHPVRRRILLILMILGNAGIVTGITSIIVGFMKENDPGGNWVRVGIIAGGVTVLWFLASSKYIDRKLSALISRILKKTSDIQIYDYHSMLHLSGEYRISEIGITKDHWLNGKRIEESGLSKEGIIILGINRKNGTYLGTPQKDTVITEDDLLILYGRASTLENLEKRTRDSEGYFEHKKSVREQKVTVSKEKEEDIKKAQSPKEDNGGKK